MPLPEINFKEQGPRILMIIAVIAALAVIITIIVALISGQNEPEVAINSESDINSDSSLLNGQLEANSSEQSFGSSQTGFLKDDPLFKFDLINPEEIFLPPLEKLFKFGRYEFFRGIKQQWTWEDIKQFWHDPRNISAELLEDSNNLLINSLLKSVD